MTGHHRQRARVISAIAWQRPRNGCRGGPIDILTETYLAELTMALLFGEKMKKPETGLRADVSEAK